VGRPRFRGGDKMTVRDFAARGQAGQPRRSERDRGWCRRPADQDAQAAGVRQPAPEGVGKGTRDGGRPAIQNLAARQGKSASLQDNAQDVKGGGEGGVIDVCALPGNAIHAGGGCWRPVCMSIPAMQTIRGRVLASTGVCVCRSRQCNPSAWSVIGLARRVCVPYPAMQSIRTEGYWLRHAGCVCALPGNAIHAHGGGANCGKAGFLGGNPAHRCSMRALVRLGQGTFIISDERPLRVSGRQDAY
jgi:hypothetical protein